MTNDQLNTAAYNLQEDGAVFDAVAFSNALDVIYDYPDAYGRMIASNPNWQIIAAIPIQWSVSITRQYFDKLLKWTVSLSVVRGYNDQATVRNSVSARSSNMDNAIAAALIYAAVRKIELTSVTNPEAA